MEALRAGNLKPTRVSGARGQHAVLEWLVQKKGEAGEKEKHKTSQEWRWSHNECLKEFMHSLRLLSHRGGKHDSWFICQVNHVNNAEKLHNVMIRTSLSVFTLSQSLNRCCRHKSDLSSTLWYFHLFILWDFSDKTSSALTQAQEHLDKVHVSTGSIL